MLIQFSVENYKSIKEEVIINFSSKNKKGVHASKIEGYNSLLFHSIGLVGPNASGKSNILSAVTFSINYIINTVDRKEMAKTRVIPFKLAEDWKKRDTSFEYIFVENKTKYVYGFSLDENRVTKEYLYAYYSKKPTTVFERDINNSPCFDFKGKNIRQQKEIADKTNANRLFLSVAAEWGVDSCKIPYDWFLKKSWGTYGMGNPRIIEKVINNVELKKEMISTLERADFNISDIAVKKRKVDGEYKELMMHFLNALGKNDEEDSDLLDNFPEVWVTHKCASGESFEIKQSNDSSGTSDLIDSIAEFLYLKDIGGLYIEDEFGKNFHTKLTKHIVELYDGVDSSELQMLFCTHETIVLNCLSPEQIYLVDKDEDGSTYVKLLDDYIIRDKDNIELGYLKGRYGAIPYMS